MVRYSDSGYLGIWARGICLPLKAYSRLPNGRMQVFKQTPELGVRVLLMSSSPNLVACGGNINKLAAVPFSLEVTMWAPKKMTMLFLLLFVVIFFYSLRALGAVIC